jgi:hypothetical protein
MRVAHVVVAAGMAVAGCVHEPARELPITSAEMPASFSYGGLGPKSAHYRQATDPRSGAIIRRMIMTAPNEVADFAAVSLSSGYVFTSTAFRRRLAVLLPPDQTVEWQESTQGSGIHPTKLVTFALPEKGLQCVGMERGLQAHHEAPSNVYSQAIVVGYYCRTGAPFSSEEAHKVGAALSARS